jgi:hypothetical protein
MEARLHPVSRVEEAHKVELWLASERLASNWSPGLAEPL